MKTAIYTAIYGDKDFLTEPTVNIPGIDWLVFTDNENLRPNSEISSPKWQIKFKPMRNIDPILAAKHIKMFPDHHLLEYDIVIWIDAQIQIVSQDYVYQLLKRKRNGMTFITHFQEWKKNINHELEDCIKHRKLKAAEGKRQIDSYQQEGFIDQMPLLIGGSFLRDNKDKKIQQFNEVWWDQIMLYTWRDQLSLPYVLWKLKLDPGTLNHRKWLKTINFWPHKN